MNAGERTTEEALRALVQAGAVERVSLGGQGGAVAYRLKDPGGLAQPPLRDSGALRKTGFADEDGPKFSASRFAENPAPAENTPTPEGGREEGWLWL